MKAIPLLIVCLLIGLNALQAQDLSKCKRTCKQTRLVQTGPLIGLRTLTLSDSQYVRVVEVVKRGASEKYGILLGDTLTHFNGKVIQNMSYFIAEVAKLQPGDTITVSALRSGVSILYRFPLGAAQTRRVTEFVCCEDLHPNSEIERPEEFALAPVLDTKPIRATTRNATKEQAVDTNATTLKDPLEDPMGELSSSVIEKSEAKRERQVQLEKEREAKRLIKAEAERLRQIEKEQLATQERQAQVEQEEAQLKKAEAELLAQQERERKAEAERLAQLKIEEDRLKKAEAERLAQLEKEQEEAQVRKTEAERLAQLEKERKKQSEPEKDLNNIVFDLSPNPAVNFLRVSANEEINYTVKLDIQDADGNILKSETVKILKGRFDVTISVEDLPNELYFLKIYVDNTQYVQRFRKEK